MKLLGYHNVLTQEKGEESKPIVDTFRKMSNADEVMSAVDEYRQTRGVLVYATGDLHEELAKERFLPCVDEETSHDKLRRMDEKWEGLYPVYLLDDDYGIRGLDFRAANNPHGICMLICSAWRDSRTRVQGLKRICRYSDNGMYI